MQKCSLSMNKPEGPLGSKVFQDKRTQIQLYKKPVQHTQREKLSYKENLHIHS